MIGIWYFNTISKKWLLFEETSQDGCVERLGVLRDSLPFAATHFKIARRRPIAVPVEHGVRGCASYEN
jgi:hypothetical protein